MQLASDIVVNKGKDEVWCFLADPQNVTKWDRGVKAVEPRKATAPPGEGVEFTRLDTMARARIKVECVIESGKPIPKQVVASISSVTTAMPAISNPPPGRFTSSNNQRPRLTKGRGLNASSVSISAFVIFG